MASEPASAPLNFNPVHFDLRGRATPLDHGRMLFASGPDGPQRSTYIYEPGLVLAVNVAFATRRPLLLAGEPGSGKTTLARNVALFKDLAYYPHTIASRSQASELLFEVDTLRRLNDAQAQRLRDEDDYVEPGVLWWALAPDSASRRGLPPSPARRATDPAPASDRAPRPPAGHRATGGAVLLIDEIDKAEPDVPNDLLEVLDTQSFSVRGRSVVREPGRDPVLVVITTNVERDLPGAFMRRCVTYRIPDAADGWFAAVGLQRHPAVGAQRAADLETSLRRYRSEARQRGDRIPGTAEYLDALAALEGLGITARDAAWQLIEQCIFGKQASVEGGRAAP